MYPSWRKIWSVPLDKRKKAGAQIVARIIQLINNSDLVENDRLPPAYTLAEKLGTTPATINLAYNKLQEAHLVEIKRGIGSFVADYLPIDIKSKLDTNLSSHTWEFDINKSSVPALKTPYIILGSEHPDVKRIAIMEYLNFYRKVLLDIENKKDSLGLFTKEVKTIMLKVLRQRGINVKEDNYELVPYDAAFRCVVRVLIKPRDVIVMDSQDDFAASGIFLDQNADVLYCGSDEEGLKISVLERMCKRRNVKLVFVRPGGSFPTLSYMSDKRRNTLVAMSIKYNFIIVCKDDNFGFWHKQPIAPLYLRAHHGNIIYIGPVSGLSALTRNMSLIVSTPFLINAIRKEAFKYGIKHEIGIELTVSRLMERGWIEKDSKRLLKHYRTQQNNLKDLFYKYLGSHAHITLPKSGLSIYIKFKLPLEIKTLLKDLTEYGIYDEYQNQHINTSNPIQAIRLGYGEFSLLVWERVFKIFANQIKLYSS